MSNASEDLPEPDKPGDHDQPVARQIEIDVLEVVRARAADADELAAGACGRVALGVQRASAMSGLTDDGVAAAMSGKPANIPDSEP